jgi:hypothetical protein
MLAFAAVRGLPVLGSEERVGERLCESTTLIGRLNNFLRVLETNRIIRCGEIF